MRRPELPVVSFLCIPLLFCSLPSHIRARSVATLALIAWLAVMSIIRGVNALVWANNVAVKFEVWCDITTKITIGFTYAVPASALCVLRQLESVSSSRTAHTSKSDKQRRQKFEALMCFGVPLIGMALHYVVQGHRLDLIEDFGCYPPVYFSIAAIFILWVPPFAMSLVTFIYAGLSLRHFLRHRIEFAARLRNSQSAMTPSRYLRLMALALIEMIWDSGVNAYLIYFNTFTGIRPWTSWEDVHSNFSRVATFPEALIPPMFITQLIWQWWIVPISCILFFIFFGFGGEAMADYRTAFVWFRRTVLQQNVNRSHSIGSVIPLPTHYTDVTLRAFSDNESKRDAKTWSKISLKLPQIAERVLLPSAGAPPLTTDTRCILPLDNTHFFVSTPGTKSRSFSLEHQQRTASIYTSESSSITAVESSTPSSPTHCGVGPNPSLTQPDTNMLPSAISSTSSPTGQIRTFRSVPEPPSSLSLSAQHRSDPEIIISPAYYPVDIATSQPSTTNVIHAPPPEPDDMCLHGGVHILVERSVV